jgi:putative thiamine transport system permease protein
MFSPLRLFPAAALILLVVPVVTGVAGILLPALGYFPALGGASLSLAPLRALSEMPGLARSAMLSFGIGLTTTGVAFAIVVLFVAGWRGTRVFAVLERLVSPLLSVPHAAAAFGFAFLVAPSGLFFRLLAEAVTGWEKPPDLLIVQDRLGIAMTLGLIMKEIPFLLLMTLAALPLTRAPEIERMMAALGYGRIAGFVHGVLPALYRQIRLAVLAVLAFSTSVVDVALILGPTTPAPLAVRILDWQNDPDLSQRFVGAAGAVLQIGVTASTLLIWLGAERVCAAIYRVLAQSGWRALPDAWLRHAAAIVMALSSAIVLAGLALLALWSVAGPWWFPRVVPESVSLSTWMRVAASIGMPVRDTLLLGFSSSIIAVVLALGTLEWAARSGRTETGRAFRALYVPLIVPQIAFLFGLQILFAWLDLDGTLTAVLLVHLVFVFPYVLLSLSDPWWSWDPRYGHVARAVGRSQNAIFWRVRLPMLTRPVLTAGALGFAISVGLYLPTLMIGGGRWPTLTTETVALASGGDPRLIGATALLQALFPFLGFLVAAIVPAILFRNRRALRVSP